MSRKEFMAQLELLLMDISQEERIEALAFYNSYFEDAGPGNEAKIIQELESPEKVARVIKADIGQGEEKEYTETGYEDTRFHEQEEVGMPTGSRGTSGSTADFKEKPKGNPQQAPDDNTRTVLLVLAIVVAVVTCPAWGGLIIGVIGTVIGILVAAAAVVFALYVAGVVLFGVGCGAFFAADIAVGLGLCGAGMFVLALAILGTLLCVLLFGKFLPWMVRGCVELCSRGFQAISGNRARG